MSIPSSAAGAWACLCWRECAVRRRSTRPTNFEQGWDWCSGYHYSDTVMTGFTLLHLSGTGCGDLSEILFMPDMGKLSTNRGSKEKPKPASLPEHSMPTKWLLRLRYYAVKLDDGIKAELSATERAGIMRYTFPDSDEAHVIIDLKVGQDSTEASLERSRSTSTRSWDIVFAGVDSKPARVFLCSLPSRSYPSNSSKTKKAGTGSHLQESREGVISYKRAPKEVLVKVGLSPVSTRNAEMNF